MIVTVSAIIATLHISRAIWDTIPKKDKARIRKAILDRNVAKARRIVKKYRKVKKRKRNKRRKRRGKK